MEIDSEHFPPRQLLQSPLFVCHTLHTSLQGGICQQGKKLKNQRQGDTEGMKGVLYKLRGCHDLEAEEVMTHLVEKWNNVS